jgi:dethiobiotin synthetase
MEYFITGIDTNIGKTIASAVLCEALGADYWKPVQAGDLDNSDSLKVRELISTELVVYPEAYRLSHAMSPHAAAALDGIEVQISNLVLPKHSKPLIIEGAGGLMVPLNANQTILDLLQVWSIPVILVSSNYLGSINHTLLTIEVLKQRGIPLAGVLFNGDEYISSEFVIEHYGGVNILGHIPTFETLDHESLKSFADSWRDELIARLERTHPLRPDIENRVRLIL